MDDPTAAVTALAAPIAERHGVALLDVSVKGSGSRTRVRLIVDRKGGVDVDTCQKVSAELSRGLDATDPIPGRFVLEVTSPGVDWPLSDQASFDRVEGRLVEITRTGGDVVRGVVGEAGPGAVVLTTELGPVTVAYDDMERASQALPW